MEKCSFLRRLHHSRFRAQPLQLACLVHVINTVFQGYWPSAVLHYRKAPAQQGRCSWFPMGHPHGPAILPYLPLQDKPPVSPTHCLLLLILHRQPHLLLYCGKKRKRETEQSLLLYSIQNSETYLHHNFFLAVIIDKFVFLSQSQSFHLCFGAISFSPSYIHYTGLNAWWSEVELM